MAHFASDLRKAMSIRFVSALPSKLSLVLQVFFNNNLCLFSLLNMYSHLLLLMCKHACSASMVILVVFNDCNHRFCMKTNTRENCKKGDEKNVVSLAEGERSHGYLCVLLHCYAPSIRNYEEEAEHKKIPPLP